MRLERAHGAQPHRVLGGHQDEHEVLRVQQDRLLQLGGRVLGVADAVEERVAGSPHFDRVVNIEQTSSTSLAMSMFFRDSLVKIGQTPGCRVGLEEADECLVVDGRVLRIRASIIRAIGLGLGLNRFVGINNQFLELLGDVRRLPARLLVKPGQTHSRDDIVPHVLITSLLIHALKSLLVHELKNVLILEDRSILHADFPALILLLTLYGDKGHAFAAGLTRDDLALKGHGIEQVRLGILAEGLGCLAASRRARANFWHAARRYDSGSELPASSGMSFAIETIPAVVADGDVDLRQAAARIPHPRLIGSRGPLGEPCPARPWRLLRLLSGRSSSTRMRCS